VKRPILPLVWVWACLTLGLSSLASSPTISQAENQDVPNDGNVRTLSPSAFLEVPKTIGKQLEALGCGIPQVQGDGEPQNVVHGFFARPGQVDWAILCSRAGRSSIVIFWGKPTKCSDRLATRDDRNYLQGDAGGHLVYSRQISSAGSKKILKYALAFSQHGTGDAPTHLRLDHAGIEDSFVGKASEIYYCSQGKWHLLQGAD
jgi:hypothetical protein